MEPVSISVPMITSIETDSEIITDETVYKILNGETRQHQYDDSNTILITLRIDETVPSQWSKSSLEIGYCFPVSQNSLGKINSIQASFIVSSKKYERIISDISAFRSVFIAEMEKMIRSCIYSNTISFDTDDSIDTNDHILEDDFRVVFVIKDICYQYSHHTTIINQMIGIAYEIARILKHENINAEILRIKDLDMTINYASELKRMKRGRGKKKKKQK